MRDILKRAVDLAGAAVGLILLMPLMGAVAIAIRLRMGRPVLYWQWRAGRHGRLFRMCKFRTMTHATDAEGRLLPDRERLTALGKFLRKTSIDELPQLWNVLKGEMSLVGPRPLVADYLPRYTPWQRRRLDVKPGITGWAQVGGRNTLTWQEKFELDIWYVENRSPRLDLKILALTAWKVLQREGISQAGHATMPEFLGSLGKES
jgi:lipopolysaccharide/colanic/teichoic acid biosynthesis glycosyltransferase